MNRRARREQRTTRQGVKSLAAMTKAVQVKLEETEPGSGSNRTRKNSACDRSVRGVGTSQRSFKNYTRPKLGKGKRRTRGKVVKGKRHKMVVISFRLHTIHPNPGPSKRGMRNNERNREYRRTRRYRRRKEKRTQKKEEEERRSNAKRLLSKETRRPKIVTWNLQRMSMRENNRRKLRQVASHYVTAKWDVDMLTEITSEEEGFFWLGEEEQKVVVIHGRRTAILLTGTWANDWMEQGSQRWLGNRVAAVKVNHCRLVCGYQPLWNYVDTTMDDYRREMEQQIHMSNGREWLVMGGDHNATVGNLNNGESASDAVGPYGLGQRNDAGRDLVRWCEEHGLVFVNSFYRHKLRGTWCHPARNIRHELDGFLMKKRQMGHLVKKVGTVIEDTYSDHRPKMMVPRRCKLGQPNIRQTKKTKKPKINWEALQDANKRIAFKEKTEELCQGLDQDRDIKWQKIATILTKAAAEVCGKRQRELTTPWVAGREETLTELKQGIHEAVQEAREKKAKHIQEDTIITRMELDEAVYRRKLKRREHKLALRAWERAYWEEKIEHMREAQEKGNYGEMYRTMRQLGQRGTAKAVRSTCFTPEEFKEHFEKVSEHEYENDLATWEQVLGNVEDQRDNEEFRTAGQELERTPTDEEIEQTIKEMKDRAPGEDDVRICYIKYASVEAQRYVTRTVQKMFETKPEEWEEMISVGLVIPLFKKGDRKDRNNYRGVCLLQMGSRILARVLATRIRRWAEKIQLIDDSQHGFRKGRSTMDAMQIVMRIQEEVSEKQKDKAALDMWTGDTLEDTGAVLLDITKAYPRVNRPAMWKILQLAGMGIKCLRTTRAIHEITTYKIKCREQNSSAWQANRGLREGCATSPVLFNIYHAEVMRQAKQKRMEESRKLGVAPGIQRMQVPGSSFPPRSSNKAMTSTDAETFRVTETLFADDTTLLGSRRELMENVNKFKETMGLFEEKCHDGKEEWVFFSKEGSANVRMLGTWLGRDKDVKERLARGNRAWWALKKRLRNTTIPKRTQAKVVEACVESTMMFDCAGRAWMKKEVKRLQQLVDRCYRYVWMKKKGGPGLRQMEQVGVNMYDIRRKLGVDSIDTKIAKRTLDRIGHVMRMDDERLTKKVSLGWLKDEWTIPGRKSRKSTTITYWKKCLREAGIDEDTMEPKMKDRNKWKIICGTDLKRRRMIEEGRCKTNSTIQPPAEMVLRDQETNHICDWNDCGRSFNKKIGLVQHQRLAHKRLELKFLCASCGRSLKQQSNLTNHGKTCRNVDHPGRCQFCEKMISASNIARHEKTCRRNPTHGRQQQQQDQERQPEQQQQQEQERQPEQQQQEEEQQRQLEQQQQPTKGRIPRWPCCMCAKDVTRGGVRCVESGRWCHYKCAEVTYSRARRWTTVELNSWRCPKH